MATDDRARPPRVADPGVRHVLRATRRALLMIAAAIAEVCGEDEGRKPP
jgi:hypothetical protein